MDYEKKYKKALERAKNLYENANGMILKEWVEQVFPELAELEDERIRKELTEYVKSELEDVKHIAAENHIEGGYVDEKKRLMSFIAWLEKQGEQKLVVTPKFRIGDIITPKGKKEYYTIINIVDGWYEFREKHVNGGIPIYYQFGWELVEQKSVNDVEPTPIFRIGDTLKKKGKDYTFIVDRIQGGYYHCDRNHGAFFPIEEQDNWELVEQKPIEEVNGEDYGIDGLWHAVRILETTLGEVEGYQSDDGILEHKAAITVVKQLKEQKPVEWSEEDEKVLRSIILEGDVACGHGRTKLSQEQITWLKSLSPQNRWKPSEEQMNALKHASNFCSIAFADIEILATLYEQLKSL